MPLSKTNTPAPLLGVAIGDALGMPFEKLPTAHPSLRWWDGRFADCADTHPFNHGLRKGQWTDDTQMTLALAASIVDNKGYDQLATLRKYLDWFGGSPRGVGGTIRTALTDARTMLDKTGFCKPTPVRSPDVRGNGVVMRLSPLSVFILGRIDDERQESDLLYQECSLTHLGPTTTRSAEILHHAIRMCHNVTSRESLLRVLSCRADLHLDQPTTDISTVQRAIACLLATDNFASAVQMAVRLGDDTDTVAACTGAMAGIWYGLEGIPDEYLVDLEDRDRILDLQRQLYAVASL